LKKESALKPGSGSNSQCGSEKGSLTKLVIGGSTEQGIAVAVGAGTRLRLNLFWAIDVREAPIFAQVRKRVNGVKAKRYLSVGLRP